MNRSDQYIGLCRLLMFAMLGGSAMAGESPAGAASDARAQVWAAECAFARSMAERDLPAFERHLSEQALFFGSNQVHRGKPAVLAAWKGFYEGAQAPFSWAPDAVEVLGDGTLAHSSGPVRNPQGEVVSRFSSVWRQEAPGQWRIVLDKGQPLTAAERERAKEPPAKPLCP
ncbi:YybH family protein [Paucibacter soli]|uniref:YybH family protein n=1 Tax=Paucibacter soli TaxID=3133433 RepID=UPI0030B73FE1